MEDIKKHNSRTKLQNDDKKQEKEIVLKNLRKSFDGREMLLIGFASKTFLIESKGLRQLNTNQSKLKMLTSNELLQRLPTALTQVHAGNNSGNLLNEIRQIAYSLYQ